MFLESWEGALPGAMATLGITLLVVLLLNPYIERRLRRHERWTDRAMQAIEHLNWQVHPALYVATRESRMKLPAMDEHRLSEDPNILNLMDNWRSIEHQRFTDYRRETMKASLLLRQVCAGPPRSNALGVLRVEWLQVELSLREQEFARLAVGITANKIDEMFQETQGHLKACIRMLEDLVQAQKPPRRPPEEWIKARLSRIKK